MGSGDLSALFDELNASIPDERASPSDRQKTILHMNGVRPSEYAGGFCSVAAMNDFVSTKIDAGQGFFQAHGQQPADGEPNPLARLGLHILPPNPRPPTGALTTTTFTTSQVSLGTLARRPLFARPAKSSPAFEFHVVTLKKLKSFHLPHCRNYQGATGRMAGAVRRQNPHP